jgi:hypothetical protein
VKCAASLHSPVSTQQMLSENTARVGDEGKAAKRGGAGGFAVWVPPPRKRRLRTTTQGICFLGRIGARLPQTCSPQSSHRIGGKAKPLVPALAALLFEQAFNTRGHWHRRCALPPSCRSVIVWNPSINPARPQATGDALTPSPFYILEPHYPRSSCSVGDDNRTPRKPAMPVHS